MYKLNFNPKANHSKQSIILCLTCLQTDRKCFCPTVSLVYCKRSLHETWVISIISNIVNCKSFYFCNNLLDKQQPLIKCNHKHIGEKK